MYPTSRLNSERGGPESKSNGSEAYTKVGEKYAACRYLRSFPSADAMAAVAVPACFTHQTRLQAASHTSSWKSLPFGGFMENISLWSP